MRGHPAPRLWVAALGGEVVYEIDLPGCCEHGARSHRDDFECGGCGAAWQSVEGASPEVCGFVVEVEQEERGAA